MQDVTLKLTDESKEFLNAGSALKYRMDLFDWSLDKHLEIGALGVDFEADLAMLFDLDYYFNLDLPQSPFDAEITIENPDYFTTNAVVGSDLFIDTSKFSYSNFNTSTALSLANLGFSTGFVVDFNASVDNAQFDTWLTDPISFDRLSFGTGGEKEFELLGYKFSAPSGENFSSEISKVADFMNSWYAGVIDPSDPNLSKAISLSLKDYKIPLDLKLDLGALELPESTQAGVLEDKTTADFDVLTQASDGFLSASLDVDDLAARILLPAIQNPFNPLLSIFEYRLGKTFFEDTRYEMDFQLLATLLDVDLEFGLKFAQQRSFEQTGADLSISQNGQILASGELGESLQVAGANQAGLQTYDLGYSVRGDLTTDYGFVFYVDIPVSVLDLKFWRETLNSGSTTTDIPCHRRRTMPSTTRSIRTSCALPKAALLRSQASIQQRPLNLGHRTSIGRSISRMVQCRLQATSR